MKNYRNYGRATYGRRQADHQQRYVYLAEDDAVKRYKARKFRSLDEIVEWLNSQILPSEWWEANVPAKHWANPEVVVIGRTSENWASRGVNAGSATMGWSGAMYLYLPRWTWDDYYILHELAHPLTHNAYQSHGPTYVKCRVELQYEFGTKGSGEVLEQTMREFGVKIAP